jgi:TonB family protein
METSRPARDPQPSPGPRANDRWKRRWGAVLRLSMITAAAAHLAVFAAWPDRELTPPEQRRALPPLQAVRLASNLAQPVFRENSSRLQPNTREVEIPVEQRADGEEIDADERLDSLAPQRPSLANARPDPSTGEPPQFAARTEIMPGGRLTVASMATSQLPFTWPEIRNPRQLIRFLRSRYNPIHTPSVAERKVGVAIGIDERGAVEWSEVLESSGHKAVDDIALAVVNQVIEFTPGSREGVPVPVVVVLSIPFQIRW